MYLSEYSSQHVHILSKSEIKKFPLPPYIFITYLKIIPVYTVIWYYIIIRYFGKFLPTRLFHPTFLLYFGSNSLLHYYSEHTTIRNMRVVILGINQIDK